MKFVQSCKRRNIVCFESTDNLQDFRQFHCQVPMFSKVYCQTIHARPGVLRHRLVFRIPRIFNLLNPLKIY